MGFWYFSTQTPKFIISNNLQKSSNVTGCADIPFSKKTINRITEFPSYGTVVPNNVVAQFTPPLTEETVEKLQFLLE